MSDRDRDGAVRLTQLGARDLRAALTFADSALTARSFRQINPMLAVLNRVVGADRTTLTHLDQVTQSEVAVFWPEPPSRNVLEGYTHVAATHTTTVSKHLNRIYTRLDLSNRTAAVVYWKENVQAAPATAAEDLTSPAPPIAGSSCRRQPRPLR